MKVEVQCKKAKAQCGKFIKVNNGFTLVEVIIVVAIIVVLIGISYEFFLLTSKHTKNELEKAYIRSDFRLAQKFLTEDIRYFNGEISVGNSFISLDDITYSIVDNKLTRNKNGSMLVFSDIHHVEFKLENSNLVRISFNEDSHKFAVAIWSYIASNIPDDTDSFSYFVQEQDVFVYGSELRMVSGAFVKGESSTIVVVESEKGYHDFSGDNDIHVYKLYIDDNVRFSTSTRIGQIIEGEYETKIIYMTKNVAINNGGVIINSEEIFIDGDLTYNNSATINCDTIYIKGDLSLNNGSAKLKAKTIFVDGNVSLTNSAKIECDNIYIKGDLLFQNWGDKLISDFYYVGGSISKTTTKELYGEDGHLEGVRIFDPVSVPEPPESPVFPDYDLEVTLRPVEWYSEKGYTNPVQLSDNVKIFSEGDCNYSSIGHLNTFNNVVIISTGDITLGSMDGGGDMCINYGFLYAPFGKVTFYGKEFKGIVIARDGFVSETGDSNIEFKSLEDFFENKSEYPFQ